MNENQFITHTSAALQQIEQWLETHSPDSDCVETAPGVLAIETPDGLEIILNRHEVSQELWLASRRGAHHFRYDPQNHGTWHDTRSGEELLSVLAALLGVYRT